MSGPVWRFEQEYKGPCALCLREFTGIYLEGEVVDGEFWPQRAVCPSCFAVAKELLLTGEKGLRTPSPAYAHR